MTATAPRTVDLVTSRRNPRRTFHVVWTASAATFCGQDANALYRGFAMNHGIERTDAAAFPASTCATCAERAGRYLATGTV